MEWCSTSPARFDPGCYPRSIYEYREPACIEGRHNRDELLREPVRDLRTSTGTPAVMPQLVPSTTYWVGRAISCSGSENTEPNEPSTGIRWMAILPKENRDARKKSHTTGKIPVRIRFSQPLNPPCFLVFMSAAHNNNRPRTYMPHNQNRSLPRCSYGRILRRPAAARPTRTAARANPAIQP